MAIGTTAAILGAAVIGAGGSILANKSQSKANAQAAEVQNNATDAQLQLGRESLALNQSIYNSNYDTLSPYVGRGNVAGDSINALLGLPAAPAMRSPLAGGSAAPTGAAPAAASAAPAYGGAAPAYGGAAPAYGGASTSPTGMGALMPGDLRPDLTAPPGVLPYRTNAAQAYIANANGVIPGTIGTRAPGATPTPAAPVRAAAGAAAAPSATDAFENFANSAGMQFQIEQGTNAINNMYAGRGALQSGAAMKAISDYVQNTALNNYFMPYMGLLGGQQAVGATAASSIAGVGTNFGNTAANINTGMGNAINSGAQNIGNLALANGQNTANMWSGIGSSVAGAAGLASNNFGYGFPGMSNPSAGTIRTNTSYVPFGY